MDTLTLIFAGAFIFTLVLLIRSLFRQAGVQDAIQETTAEAEGQLKLWEEFGEHLDEGVALLDESGTVQYVNRTFAEVTGWKGRSAFSQPFESVLSISDGGKPVRLDEKKRKGEVRSQTGSVTPVYGARRALAQPAGYQVVVLQDATASEAEKALRHRLVNLSTFELRAPITAMKGYADLLLSGDFGKLGKDAQSKVQTILESADKLLRTIDDMGRIESLSEEKVAMQRRPVKAADFQESASKALASVVAEAGRTLKADDAPSVTLSIDATEIERLLGMVANTAARTAKTGSAVTFRIEDAAANANLRLENIGPPLPQDQHHSVFDYVGAQGFGEGIGYYVAQQIIAAHHASFSVSQTKTGNAFVLSVPKAETAPESKDDQGGKAASRGGLKIDISK